MKSTVAGLGLVLIVAGCTASGPTPSLAPDSASAAADPATGPPASSRAPASGEFDEAYGPSSPVDVEVEVSEDNTFTTSVTVAGGGFFSLYANDGSSYQLEIPPGALLSDTEITMTVVESVGDSPLGSADDFRGGVLLEPAGLELFRPAVLTIIPSEPVDVADEGPFTANSDGTDFHLFPLDPDPSAIRLNLMHFSVFGLFQTDAERRAEMIRETAREVESQLEQEISEELQEARENDGELDTEALLEKLTYYRDRVVAPMMALAENDPTLFGEAVRRWLSWERQRQLLGAAEDAGLDQEIFDSFVRAFETYVEYTKERCLRHDFGAVTDLIRLERMAQLMGFDNAPGLEDLWAEIGKCATFTLEMESQAEAHLNTCMLIDAGASSADSSEEIRAAVEFSLMDADIGTPPWSGPIEWISATYEADCHLPAQGGGDLVSCTMEFAGLGDPGQLHVLDVIFDLNVVKPEPGVLAPDETVAVFNLHAVIVRPDDPQIDVSGDCQVLGFGDPGDTSESGSWLATWKDCSGPAGRSYTDEHIIIEHPADLSDQIGAPPSGRSAGEGWILTNWEFIGEDDVLAERVYECDVDSILGDESEETTFTLRHTPQD